MKKTSQIFVTKHNYKSLLSVRETEKAIRLIKEFFQINLSFELNLIRVTAPLFVKAGTGINDDLNGIERPVTFSIKALHNEKAEIIQSLAKWKRLELAKLGLSEGEGLYTDMNAIRPDETLDDIHSLYVDQWDWERVITKNDRNIIFLKKIVETIYDVIKRTEKYICQQFDVINPILPDSIHFIHSEELEEQYGDKSPVEREKIICKRYGAVFIIGIGGVLKNGLPHDGRAPDYDDWSTPTKNGYKGLNGDILIYYPVLDCVLELSSMGIRVDAATLRKQLKITGEQAREKLLFHRLLLDGKLPLSVGGGIGQSRLCMFYLRKAHIGEIQVSIWPEQIVKKCEKNNVFLL